MKSSQMKIKLEVNGETFLSMDGDKLLTYLVTNKQGNYLQNKNIGNDRK